MIIFIRDGRKRKCSCSDESDADLTQRVCPQGLHINRITRMESSSKLRYIKVPTSTRPAVSVPTVLKSTNQNFGLTGFTSCAGLQVTEHEIGQTMLFTKWLDAG